VRGDYTSFNVTNKGKVHNKNYQVYVGKGKVENTPESTKFVTDLMKQGDILNRGYWLYIDTWYSLPDLFHRFHCAATDVCRAIQFSCRHMPKELGNGTVHRAVSAT
jgi:hypothetical protein